MVITYHGKQFFKVQFGDTIFAFNPISKDYKLPSGKSTRFGASVALITTDLVECNGAEQVAYAGKDPFVITGPGEYEVGGNFIKGIYGETTVGKEKKVNTAYVTTIDNIKIAFLGFSSGKLTGDVKELADQVDILFVPVGEETDGQMNYHDAHAAVVALEPKLIIPMGYNEKTLPLFLKEAGVKQLEAVEKLTLKRKDLDGKSGEIVILSEE